MESKTLEEGDHWTRLDYALHAGGGDKYDYKNQNKLDKYRGSQISKDVYVSARDIGNYAAGAVARITHQNKMDFMITAGAFNLAKNSKLKLFLMGTYYQNKAMNAGYPAWGEDKGSNFFQRLGYEKIKTNIEMVKNKKRIWDLN